MDHKVKNIRQNIRHGQLDDIVKEHGGGVHGEQHQGGDEPATPLFGQQAAQKVHHQYHQGDENAYDQVNGVPSIIIEYPGVNRYQI